MGTKRDFIREELLVDKFMEDETNICNLEETEDSGRSVLEEDKEARSCLKG